jgi:hypothetical protein
VRKRDFIILEGLLIPTRCYNRLIRPVVIIVVIAIAMHPVKYLEYSCLSKFRELIFFANGMAQLEFQEQIHNWLI